MGTPLEVLQNLLKALQYDKATDKWFLTSPAVYGLQKYVEDCSKVKCPVKIKFGEADDTAQTKLFLFDTKGEADAFRQGLAEMDGWLGYEEIDDAGTV